jgi:hypothetical protein
VSYVVTNPGEDVERTVCKLNSLSMVSVAIALLASICRKRFKMIFSRIYRPAELVETVVREHIPSKIDRLLLSHALVLVDDAA